MSSVELAAEVNRLSSAYTNAVMNNDPKLSDIRYRLNRARDEAQRRYAKKWKQ